MLNKLIFNLVIRFDSWVDPVCRVIDRSGESILDVGCGQGYPMRLIRRVMKPRRVVGVDLFEKYIKEAKRDKLHDEYVISDIRKMKFSPKSFDIVLALQVIEHLPKKDSLKFIRSLEKIARKQVIISTPIGEMYHPAVDNNPLQLHKSAYYPEEFEKRGFKITKFGRKSLLGENGIVHKTRNDILRKFIYSLNFIMAPLFYAIPSLNDYHFYAVKSLSNKHGQ